MTRIIRMAQQNVGTQRNIFFSWHKIVKTNRQLTIFLSGVEYHKVCSNSIIYSAHIFCPILVNFQ